MYPIFGNFQTHSELGSVEDLISRQLACFSRSKIPVPEISFGAESFSLENPNTSSFLSWFEAGARASVFLNLWPYMPWIEKGRSVKLPSSYGKALSF